MEKGQRKMKIQNTENTNAPGKTIEETAENRNLETEAALKRSESEKWAILNGLRGLVTVRYLDPELRILWDNTDLEHELNARGRTTSGNYCYRIIRGRTEPCTFGCTPIKTLETGEMEKMEAKLNDGRVFVERSNPVKDSTGAILGVIFVALNVTKHKQIEERLKITDRFLHSFLENSPSPITVLNRDGRIELVNPAWERLVGLKRNQVVGQLFDDIFPSEPAKAIKRSNSEILRTGRPQEFEESIDLPSGLHYFHTVKFPLQNEAGDTVVGTIWVDVTARKRAERDLTKRGAELKRKSRQLAETNTALRVLLAQREEDQRELEKRVVANVKQLVLPYVRKLKGMRLNENQMNCLEIVETHLQDIVAPFLRQVVSDYPHMTAKEIEVATLVREGKSNKEIAEIMNLSVNTVQIHRYNLRKKLGLQNQKMNLRSYLLSLNGAPR
jgi:PAS domain S-box-containing protein